MKPGSISHGTLRSVDLLRAFAGALQDRPELLALTNEAWVLADALEGSLDNTVQNCLDCLMDALETLAPPGHYFGTLEGDGSDFGFWPEEYKAEEEERVNLPIHGEWVRLPTR